jgi:hypothetical protein
MTTCRVILPPGSPLLPGAPRRLGRCHPGESAGGVQSAGRYQAVPPAEAGGTHGVEGLLRMVPLYVKSLAGLAAQTSGPPGLDEVISSVALPVALVSRPATFAPFRRGVVYEGPDSGCRQ